MIEVSDTVVGRFVQLRGGRLTWSDVPQGGDRAGLRALVKSLAGSRLPSLAVRNKQVPAGPDERK